MPSSSLIPTDPSVLFTTAGMQQFKPYYLGEKSPFGSNVATSQKCFRTSDIGEVGDESHVTFLEMLGNFSFGGYFKEEAIKLAYEFLFKELKLPLNNVVFTVFEGDKDIPEDKESILIWKELGIKDDKIKKMGRKDNFWGPTGEEGPCGPTTEIHIKGTEIWNLVFNEYYQDKNGKLTPLKQKGVDTGMGLERLAMVVQDKDSVYGTDLFSSIVNEIPGQNEKQKRIIADHIKGAVFLISEDILPSNVERGYILRRILRRAIRYGKLLNLPKNFLISLAPKAVEIYQDVYPEIKSQDADILTVIQNEEEKFERTLEEGEKIVDKIIKNELGKIGGKEAFNLYQSYGFPIEITIEDLRNRGVNFDEEELRRAFEEELKRHQEVSRAGAEKKFVGGLVDHSEKTIKYHTAAHLMLAALRKVLGPEIYQKGSNITAERLRFDFSYSQKMTAEEIKEVEDIVNQKIKEDLEVICEEMSLEEAKGKGAMGVFENKYGERVKVYTIGNSSASSEPPFSREICGGPHVKKTSELGKFKIIKEESSAAGVRRIRAVLQ